MFDINEFNEYCDFVNNIPKLTYKESNELLKNNDLESKKRLVEGSLRLVFKYVVDFYNYYSKYLYLPFSLMDYVQDANELLVKLVYGDYKYGSYDLLKFAFHHSILGLLKKRVTINEPSSYVDEYVDILKFQDEYYKKFRKEPSIDIIADTMDLSISHAEVLERMFKPFANINGLNNDDYNSLIDESIESEVFDKGFKEAFFDSILESTLTKKQKEVVINHYGLGDVNPCGTLSETGELLGVTRQAIKRTLENSKDKLKKDKQFVKKLDEWKI